ncbi:MAG: serine/threonine protein kinase [Chloroflexi bacterium]|nr:serine/threonine protein kinase [Chloroflexota bacterium]MYC01149.1 serine/threonine protein kinase [Chloroflexota bacterium]
MVTLGISVQLDDRTWEVGERLGGGGFGEVYVGASPEGEQIALKFIRKEPAADRELLINEQVSGLPNVLPTIGFGETDDQWVIGMPIAETSLEQRLQLAGDALAVNEAVRILLDIARGLAALEEGVVHRDLKPANVLSYQDSWHIADFGIARYADASTGSQTWKEARSRDYAAPELWRSKHATNRTDIYSFGVIAYQLLAGRLPFVGESEPELQQLHLYETPGKLDDVDPSLASLVASCLLKPQESRPTAGEVLDALQSIAPPTSELSAMMQALNRDAQHNAATLAAAAERQRDDEQRRQDLLESAHQRMARIVDLLVDKIQRDLPLATLERSAESVTVALEGSTLVLEPVHDAKSVDWGNRQPDYDVIAYSSVAVRSAHVGTGRYYVGYDKSLWFCDAVSSDQFHWHLLEFRDTSTTIFSGPVVKPSAQPPGARAGNAIARRIQPGWIVSASPRPIYPGKEEEAVDRWLADFVQACQGMLQEP